MSKRSANFSNKETAVLMELVQKYQNIINNKRTDQSVLKEKLEAWKEIENEFNMIERLNEFNLKSEKVYRSYEVLKRKYENIKKITKRKYKEEKKPFYATTRRLSMEASDTNVKVHEVWQQPVDDSFPIGVISLVDNEDVSCTSTDDIESQYSESLISNDRIQTSNVCGSNRRTQNPNSALVGIQENVCSNNSKQITEEKLKLVQLKIQQSKEKHKLEIEQMIQEHNLKMKVMMEDANIADLKRKILEKELNKSKEKDKFEIEHMKEEYNLKIKKTREDVDITELKKKIVQQELNKSREKDNLEIEQMKKEYDLKIKRMKQDVDITELKKKILEQELNKSRKNNNLEIEQMKEEQGVINRRE